MHNVYLVQPAHSTIFDGNESYWFPYSVGCLWSYAVQHKDITDNFNLINSNPEAVRIAKATLGKVAQVIGITGSFPKDTSVMYGRPFEIYVVRGEYENKNGEKKPKNEIKKYQAVQAKVNTKPASTDGW